MQAYVDLDGVLPKDCIMRIYRDVRFSKDKSPYKTNFGAAIGAGGKRSTKVPFFVHIQPGNRSALMAGLHSPSPEQLAKWRRSIDENPIPLTRILNGAEFKKVFGELWGEKLSRPPRGFAPDHPHAEMLKLKQFAAVHGVRDPDVLSSKFAEESARVLKAAMPFLDFLSSVV